MFNNLIALLKGYVLFDVHGRRFWLYTDALNYFHKIHSGEFNGLRWFTGWVLIKKKSKPFPKSPARF